MLRSKIVYADDKKEKCSSHTIQAIICHDNNAPLECFLDINLTYYGWNKKETKEKLLDIIPQLKERLEKHLTKVYYRIKQL